MQKKCIITVSDMKQNFLTGIHRLEAMGIRTVWDKELLNTADEQCVIDVCKDYDYVIAGSEKWSAKALKACSRLKCLVRFGVGYDAVDVQAAIDEGIALANIPGVNAHAVAEHALALMMSISRQLSQRDHAMRSGNLGSSLDCVPSISCATIGILGCGNIGKQVVKMMSGFGCKFIAYDTYRDEAFANAYDVRYVGLDELFAESDFITIHTPLLPFTKGIINKDTIAKMKKSAVIVNTSRGGMIVSADLAQALRAGRLMGAGLDVFEDEGSTDVLMGHDFLDLDNIILTPHVSANTFETLADMLSACIDIIELFDNGQPIPTLLNKGYEANARA